MIKWKAIGLISSVYMAGIISGVAGGFYFIHSQVEKARELPETKQQDMYMRRMTRKLSLSEQQRQQLRTAVKEFNKGLQNIESELKPQKYALTQKALTRLDNTFTDEQKEKIERALNQMSKRGASIHGSEKFMRGERRRQGMMREKGRMQQSSENTSPPENIDTIRERIRSRLHQETEEVDPQN